MDIYKHYMRPVGKGLKLHLGCGDYWFEGYINIDFNIYGGTDMLFDIRRGLPFQPQTVEIIEAYEVLEHFSQDEVFNLLEDWKRVLIPGGKIKISVPDMDGLVEKYQTDKEEATRMIYGFVDHPSHKWGYTKESLKEVFNKHGFNVTIEQGSMPERATEPQLLLEGVLI